MRISVRWLVGGLVCAGVGFVAGAVARGDAGRAITRRTVAELKWAAVPGMPVMEAPGWSNRSGAYCRFTKFPKGTRMPLHHHTADVSGIVVAGQWVSREAGSKAKLLSPGGYQFIPGGLVHATECGAETDCVVFTCGPAAFDLVEEKPAAQ